LSGGGKKGPCAAPEKKGRPTKRAPLELLTKKGGKGRFSMRPFPFWEGKEGEGPSLPRRGERQPKPDQSFPHLEEREKEEKRELSQNPNKKEASYASSFSSYEKKREEANSYYFQKGEENV